MDMEKLLALTAALLLVAACAGSSAPYTGPVGPVYTHSQAITACQVAYVGTARTECITAANNTDWK